MLFTARGTLRVIASKLWNRRLLSCQWQPWTYSSRSSRNTESRDFPVHKGLVLVFYCHELLLWLEVIFSNKIRNSNRVLWPVQQLCTKSFLLFFSENVHLYLNKFYINCHSRIKLKMHLLAATIWTMSVVTAVGSKTGFHSLTFFVGKKNFVDPPKHSKTISLE